MQKLELHMYPMQAEFEWKKNSCSQIWTKYSTLLNRATIFFEKKDFVFYTSQSDYVHCS